MFALKDVALVKVEFLGGQQNCAFCEKTWENVKGKSDLFIAC